MNEINNNQSIFCECVHFTRILTVYQELLHVLPPQSIIVMDNATFHKSKWLRENIELQGHTLEYLPLYSPDLNPIEHKWAQAKHLRRKHNCSNSR